MEVAKANLNLVHENLHSFVTLCRHLEEVCELNQQEYQVIHWNDMEMVWTVGELGRFGGPKFDVDTEK